MTRLALTTALLFCCVSSATAGLTSQKEVPGKKTFLEEVRRAAAEPPREARASASPGEMTINHQTEVLLNGRACRYEEVPANAVIRLLEVSTDRRTVLRIHFTTSR